MAAPRKVKELANLAERLIAAQANPPPGGQPAPSDSQPALTVVSDLPAAELQPQAVNPYAFDPAKLKPAAQPAAAPVAEVPGQEDWGHKYKVLKGMFDRVKTDYDDRVGQLENQIVVLTKMARPGPQDTFHPEVPAPTITDYGMTEEQVEELGGQDFIDQILKISSVGAAAEIKTLRGEITSLRDAQTDSNEDIFYSQLSALSPSWRAINNDDRFEIWLLDEEGLTGIPRRNFLTNAYENFNAETAARYFNEFEKLLPGSPDLQAEVTGEIIPDTGGGGGPPAGTPTGTVYTPEGIKNFYRDKGLGKFKGREAEADAIERDIFAAQHEGRVIRRGTAPMIA